MTEMPSASTPSATVDNATFDNTLHNTNGAAPAYLYIATFVPIALVVLVVSILIFKKCKNQEEANLSQIPNAYFDGETVELITSKEIVMLHLQSYKETFGETRNIITATFKIFKELKTMPETNNPYFIFVNDLDADIYESERAAIAIISSRRPNTDVSRVISKTKIPECYFQETDEEPYFVPQNEAKLLRWIKRNKRKLSLNKSDSPRNRRHDTLDRAQKMAVVASFDEEHRNQIDSSCCFITSRHSSTVADVFCQHHPDFLRGIDPLIISVIYNNEVQFDMFCRNYALNDQPIENEKELLGQAFRVRFKSKSIEKKIALKILQCATKEYQDYNLSLRQNKKTYIILGFSKNGYFSTDTKATNIANVSFCGIPLELRNTKIQTKIESGEPDGAMQPDIEFDKRHITCAQMKNAKKCIMKNSADLWFSHSNLIAITSEIKGLGEYDFFILLVCSGKGYPPIGEQTFPKQIQLEADIIIKVRVTEGYFSFAGAFGGPLTFHKKLYMGSDISADGVLKNGSIGLFVKHEGSMKCITSCHSIYDVPESSADINETIIENNKPVIQPGSFDIHNNESASNRQFGRIDKVVFRTSDVNEGGVGVDAALVQIDQRNPREGLFVVRDIQQLQNTGYSRKNPPFYNTGKYVEDLCELGCKEAQVGKCKTVVKSGSATAFTMGYVGMDGAEIRINPTQAESGRIRILKGQYGIKDIDYAFAECGDSGAAVFLKTSSDDELQCLGIVIGVIKLSTSERLTVVTPISAVLKELGLSPANIMQFQIQDNEKNISVNTS